MNKRRTKAMLYALIERYNYDISIGRRNNAYAFDSKDGSSTYIAGLTLSEAYLWLSGFICGVDSGEENG